MKAKLEQFNTEFNRITSGAAQEEIRANDDLSESGKAKKMQELDNLSRLEIIDLGSRLRREVVVSAMSADNLQDLGNLLKRDFGEWDYNRLAYQSKAVESALAQAGGDFKKIAESFSKVLAAGDKHAIKAWGDVAPALLPTETQPDKFGIQQDHINEEKAAFLGALEDAEFATLNDEGRRLATERKGELEHLAQLQKIANGIDDFVTVPGATRTRHAAHIFEGVDLDSDKMIESKPNEKPEDFIKRTNEATAVSREGANEMARKLGVKIDWDKQA